MDAPVIELRPTTWLLRCQAGDAVRYIGVISTMRLTDLHHVLRHCFHLADDAPWRFNAPADAVLRDVGTSGLTYHWGLWDVHVDVLDRLHRDGTAAAQCVSAEGDFFGEADVDRINAELHSFGFGAGLE